MSDDFHSHPKVIRAGNAAIGLWVRCASYASHYLTDGHVPAETAVRYAGRPREVTALTDAGLWTPAGAGYDISGYLEVNPSAEEWRAYMSMRTKVGRKGGMVRAAKARRDEAGHFLPADNGEPW